MKKIILSTILLIVFLITTIISYLSFFGYETEKFNSLIEKKITSNFSNAKIDFDKIKIKINIKKLSFFATTKQPKIEYYDNNINLDKIDAYINLKSLLIRQPEIDKINILSNEITILEIKNFVKYFKPSNFKKFILNDIENGTTSFNLDLDLKNNKIKNYEINGVVKNFFATVSNVDIIKASFIYSIKENNGVIDKVRGLINGIQITSGNLTFDNSKTLLINGNLNSDFNLKKSDINNFLSKNTFQDYKNLKLNGKIKSSFEINFDQTLKLIGYDFKASGELKNAEIEFKEPKQYSFIKNKIGKLNVKKSGFKIDLNDKNKNLLSLSGSYSVNSKQLQKFDISHNFDTNNHKITFKGDFDGEINIPVLNFNTNNKTVNINTIFEINKNKINLKKFTLEEQKNKIDIKDLILENEQLIKFEKISVKTEKDDKINNDFSITFGNKIKVKGSKYDASNLTKLLEKQKNSDFFKNITKEISINIREISTNVVDVISNYNLIGNIDRGTFNKIVSKGEFEDGKYLDISLLIDKTSKKKILEIYSDLPKALLSNYKFFNGLSGGQLLLYSSYDSETSKTNLTIENFKVKEAPGLVKLLSLADFGGMVDALSGEGLSFERLEMKMNKKNKLLTLEELYAIGPSISILMDGYVESSTDLISLRGTMVPAKTLNKFLSKLPIVGDILIPKEIGEGLFGISFKMKGKPGKIKTTVNPVKSLTPRFIQKALKKSN